MSVNQYDALDGIKSHGKDGLSKVAAAVAWLVSRSSLLIIIKNVY